MPKEITTIRLEPHLTERFKEKAKITGTSVSSHLRNAATLYDLLVSNDLLKEGTFPDTTTVALGAIMSAWGLKGRPDKISAHEDLGKP